MSHSQPISRAQLSLKKRNQPSATQIPIVDVELNGKAKRNGSSNGRDSKNGNGHNDVLIIEDDNVVVLGKQPMLVIEKVAQSEFGQTENGSPRKKKTSRKSKDSVEEKIVAALTEVETVKATSPKKTPVKQLVEEEIDEEMLKKVFCDDFTFDDDKSTTSSTSKSKDTKVMKLTSDLLSMARRSDRLQNASTIVNLSSVANMTTIDDTMESNSSDIHERKVSGRRSTRPIDESHFNYRNQNDSLNSTMNATVGSEIHNDSVFTPGMLSSDRKRRPVTESMENIDSPKRSRLDFSGIFNTITSPVALLRNKFRRTNLGSSTPMRIEMEPLDVTTEEDAELQEINLNASESVEVIADEAIEQTEDEELVVKEVKEKSRCIIM